MRGSEWYAYVYPKNLELMKTPKILVPDIAAHSSFALDETGQYAYTSGYGITLIPTLGEAPKYVLGLLNSKLLDFFWRSISTPMRGGYFRYFTQYIEQLPIRRIDFTIDEDASRHDRMVGMVESMLQLHKDLPKAKTDQEKTVLQRQIATSDKQIDALVYELYGLTEEEIKIVEGTSHGS